MRPSWSSSTAMLHTEMKKKSTKGTLDEHIRNHWGVKKRWNVYLSTFQTQKYGKWTSLVFRRHVTMERRFSYILGRWVYLWLGKFYCHNSSAKNCSHASKKKFLSARKDFQWGQKKWTLAQNDSDLAKKVTTLKAISAWTLPNCLTFFRGVSHLISKVSIISISKLQ